MFLDVGKKLYAKIKTDDIQSNLIWILFLFNFLCCFSSSDLDFWTQINLPNMFLSWKCQVALGKFWKTKYFYMASMHNNKSD